MKKAGRAAGLSEGKYLTMGVKESDDIVLWAKEIVQKDENAQIVLHGISMGAATVVMTTAKHPQNVVAAVEDCGYTSAYDMFTNQLDVIFGLPEFPIMTCVDIVSGIKTGVKVSDAAPIKAVPGIKVPIMFIHGTADKHLLADFAHLIIVVLSVLFPFTVRHRFRLLWRR